MPTASYNAEKSAVTLERGSLNEEKFSHELTTTLDLSDGSQTRIETKPTFLQRVKTFGVIEAYFFLTVFSVAVKNFVDVKLTFVKACVIGAGLSAEECNVLDENSDAFKEADRTASYYIMIGSWTSTATTMVMGLLIGSFCDKYQKKVPLVLAPLGLALETAFSVFSTLSIDSPLIILALSKALSGVFGGLTITLSGTYAYISQVTAVKSRQIRFAILQMLLLAGVTIGTVAGGFLFQDKYYTLVYGISIGANVVGMLLLALFMEDKSSQTKGMTFGEIAKALFSFDCLTESYRLVVSAREGNKRLQIWLLILASFVTDVPLTGTKALMLLYVKKRYSWDTETTAYVTGALRFATAFVTIAGVRVFTKKLKLRDTIIALIGYSSLAGDYLCRGLATSGVMYAAAYAIGALNGCANSASDSLVTRLLDENEIGKVFVFKSLVESASPAVGTSFFSMVTGELESSIPGALFISASMWIAIPIMVLIWILFYGTAPTAGNDNHDPPGASDEPEKETAAATELRRGSFICKL